ncbi:hypothetical protein DN752_21385 [Echinicola strongylocentroti]|uniref:Uncharacterized protein n=1 Tax=Echinicola strongylocentroti TaxID=1795355 RepID=A0A2Z4INL6_9BACT|nr:hypothetical protein [Echinicola strongylocentroti]AWW32495.1 hypothetical protein DN752_21385 [Echinicola strongylocentroti]
MELYQEVVAEEPGYYYIYLSNDSRRLSEAFLDSHTGQAFDYFEVEVSEGPVVQMTEGRA